jgi:triosephosphate isomerase
LLPEFDFRPYHVGADIRKGMTIPPDAKQPKFETTFIMEKNGQRKEFTLDNYPDSTWKFIDSKTVQTEKGFEPEIHDFSIQDKKTGEDITREVIDRKGYTFLLIAPHLEQADDSNFGDIDQIYEYAEDNKIPFLCLTASNEEGMKHWQDITGAEYPFYITDETTLKTIVRSNPGLILLKNGIIIGKWSHNNLPAEEELSTPLNKAKMGQMQKDNIPRKILVIILWFVLPLVLLTIADRLWAWSRWIKEKENSNKIYQLLKQKRNEKENCSR